MQRVFFRLVRVQFFESQESVIPELARNITELEFTIELKKAIINSIEL